MTSRERIACAIAHTEPDRVPLDLGSTKVTGIAVLAYQALLEELNLRKACSIRVVDIIQQLAAVEAPVLDRLQIDTFGVFPNAPANWRPIYEEADGYRCFTDEWGLAWRMPLINGYYYDLAASPLSGLCGMEGLASIKWPDPAAQGRLDSLAKVLEGHTQGDRVLIMGGSICAGFFEMGLRLRGYEQFYMDLALDGHLVEALMDRILQIKLAFWDRVLDVASGSLDIVYESDDFGGQNGLLVSPVMYRRFFKQRQRELFAFIKKRSPNTRIFLHSCGSIAEVIPDLIEVGVDILNPVQTTATGMNAVELKRRFGGTLVFWGGGVDTQWVLPYGTPEQVREDVHRRIDALAPGGGFIFNTTHNIQTDVPVQNMVAMFEALRDYGRY